MPYLSYLLKSRPAVRSEWDTEDLYQELTHRYLKKLSRDRRLGFSDNARKAFLKVMAARLCSSKYQKLVRLKRSFSLDKYLDSCSLASYKEDAGSSMEKVEQMAKFKEFMGKTLSQVFELRCEGLSWEEVSARMTPKRPPNTWAKTFQRKLTTFALRHCTA